jgi:uncharacterized protein (DUF4415 family)
MLSGSFRPERRPRTSAKRLRRKSATDWTHLAAESDSGIDFSDIPRLGPKFWRRAVLRMPHRKASVTLRIDQDVLSWFRGTGRGYQTRINAVLRSYMQAAAKA